MAQLYFRYGTMNASKSTQLLTVAHNYEEQGKKALIFTPGIDNRFGTNKVTSRIGIGKPAITIDNDLNILEVIENNLPDCVLVDEVQFLSVGDIMEFVYCVDEFNIPVICYGLLRDFKGNLFPASQALIRWADKIEEIKSICKFCNKKATHVLRTLNGKPIYDGEQIKIGDNEYISVCRKHWFNPIY